LYPREPELGLCWRPSGCLDEGSVRTLKNYFKTTCRDVYSLFQKYYRREL